MRATDVHSPRGHENLPHTADVILHAWGPTREACLAEAVIALTESYAELSGAVPTAVHTFQISAAANEEMLVALLEEALYLLDAEGMVPTSALISIDSEGLRGSFEMASADDVRLAGSVPKGVARSQLTFGETHAGWNCTVTVDV